jgi:glyoxylase-like metal-dependent hydrolase (beta-lactamase superfamily II)
MMPTSDIQKQRWIYLASDVNTAIQFADAISKQTPCTYFFVETGAGCVSISLESRSVNSNMHSREVHAIAESFGLSELETTDAFSLTVHLNHTTTFPYASFLACCKTHHFFIGSCIYDEERKKESILQYTLVGSKQRKEEFLTDVSEMGIDVLAMTLLDAVDDHLSAVPWMISYRNTLAQLLPDAEEGELTSLICEFTHMAEQMIAPSRPYHVYMGQMLQNGNALRKTSKDGFYADVQSIQVTPEVTLFCFQLPGGGNIFVLQSADEQVMIDTGYGCYYPDVAEMFSFYGLDSTKFTKIIVTHGDTDHCGASGYYQCPVYMNKGTYDVILTNNRAQGSATQDSIPEQGYTTMINRLSGMHPTMNPQFFSEPQGETVGGFPLLDIMELAGLSFQILMSYGGHQHGLVYLLCREQGLLFTSDTILNLEYLSEERSAYNQFAVYFLTTVNVDSELVRRERKALLALAHTIHLERKEKGMPPLCICCGHGPLSYIDGPVENSRLIPNSERIKYSPRRE